MKNNIIIIAETDNVGVIPDETGMSKGTEINGGIRLAEDIPMGHKVSLTSIAEGSEIIRYGEVIGYAKTPLAPGEWVQESKIEMPVAPELDSIPMPAEKTYIPAPLEGYFFMGYRNPDGSVGTKNILGITASVQCVAGLTRHVEEKIRQELLPKYPNVDDIVALNHTYGCGIAIDAPASVIPVRTIQNIARNPNFGGEVLVVGLGCEKLRPERLIPEDLVNTKTGDNCSGSAQLIMQDRAFNGYNEMVEGIMKLAETFLKKLNKREREECPASELAVGMQCGGSDVFSGITSNPVLGFAADLIVRAGGSVMFSEVTEVRDAIESLVARAANAEVGKALIDEMKWYDKYLQQGHVDRSANPSPGNKEGGLSTIVEKALGSVAKSGTSPIVDVLKPGERLRKKGLTFAATPASDFVCGTLQVASGMNMHVFTTGRGTPYGLSMVPVIKVSSNSKLSKQWFDLIDFDAGPIAFGEKTIEEMGWELFHLILEVASGKKQVACDKLKLHNDLVIFNPGPVT